MTHQSEQDIRSDHRGDDRAGEGHLFIVHGRLDAIASTAVVIPADAPFSVGDHWKSAAGVPADQDWSTLRPVGWGRFSVDPLDLDIAPGDPQPWIIDSIGWTPDKVGEIAARTVAEIVSRTGDDLWKAAGRAKLGAPVIAMPLLGSGRAGHAHDRGRLAESLVQSLSAAVRETGVDVMIVASSASDYAVLQHVRRAQLAEHRLFAGLRPGLITQAQSLAAKVANHEVALFFGAGLSMGAGLPSWSGLLQELLKGLDSDLTWKEVERLPTLDQGEVIEAEARRAVDRGGPSLGERVADIISRAERPSLSHLLLAGMQIPSAVTTNYDGLYERAVENAGRTGDRREIAVLPWQDVSATGPWLLKMHGDVNHPNSIVLTRNSFVSYDSRWKPVGSVVQSLMMTKHLLVVGASLTDDNLIRFAHEVATLRRQLTEEGSTFAEESDIGTVITLRPDRAFERLWQRQFAVVMAGTDDEAGAPESGSGPSPGHARRAAARSMTIFLDAVAMFAARAPSHLLDARYQVEDDHLVESLRDAYQEALARGATHDGWAALARALRQFGAGEE
ncbi:SIR2 family protein [Serinibacter salmoneus]|uniref:SIR2-like protein n=1 Tax=Serinibacter salmoneus TaxID=556530 RepID=A0A2A9CXY8_9MICO|nr:SIR2 family protein [Serinibacter salmoneus]PFG18532.1 SIR2-like protein [Serinibacter salmoneus]